MKHLFVLTCILFSLKVEIITLAVLTCWGAYAAGKLLALSAGKF